MISLVWRLSISLTFWNKLFMGICAVVMIIVGLTISLVTLIVRTGITLMPIFIGLSLRGGQWCIYIC